MQLSETVTRIRADRQQEIPKVKFVGNHLFGLLDIDLQHGDVVIHQAYPERYVVKSVVRTPSGRGKGLADVLLLPESEYKARLPASPTITQHIASARVVAGRDINGPITITTEQYFASLDQQIANDSSIPPEEKASLREKLAAFANNPYVSGLTTSVAWDGAKNLFNLVVGG